MSPPPVPPRFNVSLNAPTPRVERRPIGVKLTKVTGKAAAAPRASDELAPVALSDLTNTTPANCFLQLWEMDKYRSTSYVNAETDRQKSTGNNLVAVIPGIVVRRATNLFEFQLPGHFTRPAFDRKQAATNGFLRLRLRDAGGTDRILNLHLPQYEGFYELGATIRLNPADTTYGALTDFVPFQVRNEIGSIRRQVADRGGITVSLAGNWRTGKLSKNGNPKYTNGNDAEFERQSEGTLDVLPSFVPDDERQARIGYHLFEHGTDDRFAEVPGFIESSRLAAGHALAQNDLFLDAAAAGEEDTTQVAPAPALAQCPKMATLLIFCHGTRNGLYHTWDGGTNKRTTQIPDLKHWVPDVAAHAVGHLNVAIYACSCGRGLFTVKPKKGQDPTNGRNYPGEESGFDSYGWTLFHMLRANGVPEPSVWAHTTPAHTTRNPYLRVFCSSGTGDAVNMVADAPRIADFKPYNDRFYKPTKPWVQNGNLLRELCTYHGAYLPWTWCARESILESPRVWFRTNLLIDARAVLTDLQTAAGSVLAVSPDPVTYEDASRTVITGGAEGAATPVQITRLLNLDHFPGVGDGFRLSVALSKGIQMTFDRVSNKVAAPIAQVRELLDEGQTAVLEAVAANRREKLRSAAEKLRDAGFLTHASALGVERLVVSVSNGTVTIPPATPPAGP